MKKKKEVFNKDDVSVRQKIIEASIACLEKYGMHALTVRLIAKEADVNIAAINYYFGSKDQLLEEVFKHTLNTGFNENITDFLEKYRDNPYKALELFFLELLGGGLNFPNLSKVHFYEAFVNNNYKTHSVKRLNAFLNEFQKIVNSFFPQKKEKDFEIDLIQLWSAILFPIIFPGMFRDFLKDDLKDPVEQKKYITKLIKRYFEN